MKSWQLYKRNLSILNIPNMSKIIPTSRTLNLPTGSGNIRKRDKRIRAGIVTALTWGALVAAGYLVCFCIGG